MTSFSVSSSPVASLLLLCLTLTLTTAAIVLGQLTDPAVPTNVQKCVGPLSVPGLSQRVPLLCADIGFVSCNSAALNITVSADAIPVYTTTTTDLKDWSYPYPIQGTSCIGTLSLSKTDPEIITPTYVNVKPQIVVSCSGVSLSTTTYPNITLGADCSALSCSNCTADEKCGWCTNEADFGTHHEISDYPTYQIYSTNGRCIGRGPNSQPWCATCPLTYGLGPNVCPIYTGAAPVVGGSSSTGTAETTSGLFDGNKGYQTLFALFIIALAVMGGVIVYLCIKRRRDRAIAQTTRYSRAVEMRGSNEEGEDLSLPSHLKSPLTRGEDSEYVPPHEPGSINSYAPVVVSSLTVDSPATIGSGAVQPEDL